MQPSRPSGNLVQDTPLANPVNEWLAANPDDTAAEGRLKAAMESIGLDAAVLGTFMGATRVWKALRNGNADEAGRLVDQMEAERTAHMGEASGAETVEPSSGLTEGRGEALAGEGSTTAPLAQPGA
jgi:hypothetical protein